jgi:hypothetical protein
MAFAALLLVLTAASIVHSSAVAHAQPTSQSVPSNGVDGKRPMTGKAGEGISMPAADMRAAILEAVHSGHIEDLRQAIELNEIAPVIGDGAEGDPIATLRKASRDGDGRDVLAALGRILDEDWIALPLGRDIENNLVYVWPRYAETGLARASADDVAALIPIVPAAHLASTLEKGIYDGWRIGIAADGTWHFLRR